MTTEYSGSGDVSRSLELLWKVQRRPTRGPKPGLSIERIVTAAVTVADTEGIVAVSMRRVAAELGVGTMSLYRYVPGKGELLDLMLDSVAMPGAASSLEGEPGWRHVLEVIARDYWRMYDAHPWLLQVDQVRPIIGPNALMGVEIAARGLAATPLTDRQKFMVLTSVEGFAAGVARGHVAAQQIAQRTGMSDQEFWEAQEPILSEAMRSGAYPAMAQMSENSFGFDYEEVFEFGLKQLLDGLEATIDRLR